MSRPILVVASLALALALGACAGAPPPATASPELTAASPATRMTNGTGRPDAEIAPLVSRALDAKLRAQPVFAQRFVLVPVLEPATQLAGNVSVSVRVEVRSRADDTLVTTARKTVARPGAQLGDRKLEDELLTRAIEGATDDVLAHADALATK